MKKILVVLSAVSTVSVVLIVVISLLFLSGCDDKFGTPSNGPTLIDATLEPMPEETQ